MPDQQRRSRQQFTAEFKRDAVELVRTSDRPIAEMLGHSQIGITLDLYCHVTATMQQQAVTALDGPFGDQLSHQHGGQDGGQIEIDGP